MAKANIIRFRVSSEEHDRIKNEAKTSGYVTISSYLRELVLKRNLLIETKILETNHLVRKLIEAKNV